MDRRIRQVAGTLTALLLAVATMAGYVQGVASERIAVSEAVSPVNPAEQARNLFRIFQDCRWERGAVLSVDGEVLAESVPVTGRGRCHYERRYPTGPLAAHVVGQTSLYFGKSGLEATYNADLVGKPVPAKSLAELLEERPRIGNTVVSTIDTRLQRVALEALTGRRGGVVALNPKTGAVLVAASNPSYDPNPLASHERAVADRARCELGIGPEDRCYNPNSPLLSVALQARRQPGSTFKVVTAAAAIESGKYKPSTSIPSTSAYTAPGDTRAIHNFGGGSCGGSLARALTVSCNTAFARVAVEVGADQLLATAHAMGMDQFGGTHLVGCDGAPLSELDATRTGCLPAEVRSGKRVEKLETAGFRARAGFGQWALSTSPFGMAVVAATIANGGYVPKPRFVERVVDRAGALVREIRTGIGPPAVSTETAEQVAGMMRGVVTSGTGARAFAGFGVPIAGKTGTATTDPNLCPRDEAAIFGPKCGRLPHAWFIAFGPVADPTVAVAVLIERGGGNNEEATGGRVAAPIARKVLESYFQLYPAPTPEI